MPNLYNEMEATKNWTGKIGVLPLIILELFIYLEDRLGGYL
jgi:hypothetical protein